MIRIGIYGYGNVGKSVEAAIGRSSGLSLEAVFTRRDPGTVKTASGVKVISSEKVTEYKDKIDVMILCGGSATDLPEQGPEMAKHFNIVDSFDTHAKVPGYLEKVGKNAEQNKRTAVISAGWDPGIFSMLRSLFISILPDGENNTFWGPGVSQGHSDALRRVEGVADAIQYTVPSESILNEMRSGSQKEYTMKQKLGRVCYVVAKEGADKEKIEATIKSMPNYFADYETTVNFITQNELKENHNGMAHAGNLFRNGSTSDKDRLLMEFFVKMDSNPGFTASIMLAYARAAFRLFKENNYGAKTVFDVPISYLSIKDRATQIAELM